LSSIKAKDFDKKFEEDQDQKRINVDFPAWVVESLDREAALISSALAVLDYSQETINVAGRS
jgi:hypothetical protein